MNSSMTGSFRQKFADGSLFGPFSKTCHPALIKAMGFAGFDFVILDMEHVARRRKSLVPGVQGNQYREQRVG